MVHMPTAVVQHPGDHAISVAPELSRQLDDILGQPLLIWQAARDLALRGAMLPEDAAGPTFRNAKGLPHMINTPTATGRA